MPEAKRRWTVRERDQLPDDGKRYEVIDGELFVTPAPTWGHQEAALRLYRLLSEYLDDNRVGHAFAAPADVVFSDDRGVQPDVFVVPLVDGRRPEHFDEVRELLLAVEVLSPSSARADRVEKRTLYGDEGVTEYWIVDLDARAIERTTPLEARPEVVTTTLAWHPHGAPRPFVLDVGSYFAAIER